MPTIASSSMPIGTPAPDFTLPDVVTKLPVSRKDLASPLLVAFICRHCPYVVHVRDEVAKIAKEYTPKAAGFVGISSNDAKSYPEDAPELLAEMAQECGFPFPLLYDESQEVARAYSAACTPDFFLFDKEGKLAYRGRLDDSTPGNGRPLTGADLRRALDAVLADQPVPEPHHPSAGCSIKWKR